jgi:carbonic anhydrase
MSHNAQAIVIGCMDFRFRKTIQSFVENDLKINDFDLKTDGGAVMQLNNDSPVRDWILKNIEIAFNLHAVNKVILINHTDCGAYGGSQKFNHDHKAEFDFHVSELNKAKNFLMTKYPEKEIEAYLMIYGETIKFEKIV